MIYEANQVIMLNPSLYGYLKAFHIIAVVAWFAGLFYLPRLFVYHSMTNNPISNTQFKVMEHKLFWFIMTPSGVVSIILGEVLAHYFKISGLWLHLKVFLVGTLVIYHMYCFKLMDDLPKTAILRRTNGLGSLMNIRQSF